MNELRGELSVKVGKKSHKVLLNLNAFRLLCKDKKIDLNGLDEFVSSDPLDFVPTVVYWGMMNACDIEGKERPEIGFDHLSAVICSDLDQFQELSEQIGQAMGHSMGGDKSGN